MVTTAQPKDFWISRLSQALESARCAPSARSRAAYVELARHYWSMHELINGRERAGAATWFDPSLAASGFLSGDIRQVA